MGLNWKLVLGSALGTMAEKEDEYRKFATDYYMKKHETLSEEKRAWSEKTREQKKEIQKKIDALRAEGLTDNQIANGINTYGENFFAVVADDLSKYKSSDNYNYLMSQDKTGAKFRKFYRDRFDTLIQTESQQGLQIDPVVQGLMDKFPEMMDTPEIAQSVFGFDYTKGIRDDIKGLSKDTNVPDYDAPAGLTGVSDILGGTIRDVPSQQTYTGTMLDKQIIKRLQVKYGDFKLNVDSTRFETQGEKDQKKLNKIKSANDEALKIQRKFNEQRREIPPASMEGGMSDQQLLEKITDEMGITSATKTRISTDDQLNQGEPTEFASNVATYTSSNPESRLTQVIEEMKGAQLGDNDIKNYLELARQGKSDELFNLIEQLDIEDSAKFRIKADLIAIQISNLQDVYELLGIPFNNGDDSTEKEEKDEKEKSSQQQKRRRGFR